MILSSHGIIGSSIVQIDADWLAYYNRVIDAGGTLSTTEQNATKQLVADLKANSLWTQMKAIYPMVGASAAACAQNLKSSSFTGTFNGGWTFASTGVTPNGTNAYMDTNLNEDTVLNLNNTHISVYLRTNIIGLLCDIGLGGTGGTNIYPNFNNRFYPRVNATNGGILVNLNTAAFFMANRTNSTQVFGFRNSTKYILSNDSITKVNVNITLSAENGIASRSNFSPRQNAFASIGDGLTDTEADDFYTAVQAFQTTLSRQV